VYVSSFSRTTDTDASSGDDVILRLNQSSSGTRLPPFDTHSNVTFVPESEVGSAYRSLMFGILGLTRIKYNIFKVSMTTIKPSTLNQKHITMLRYR